jgi:hypothetical protein
MVAAGRRWLGRWWASRWQGGDLAATLGWRLGGDDLEGGVWPATACSAGWAAAACSAE